LHPSTLFSCIAFKVSFVQIIWVRVSHSAIAPQLYQRLLISLDALQNEVDTKLSQLAGKLEGLKRKERTLAELVTVTAATVQQTAGQAGPAGSADSSEDTVQHAKSRSHRLNSV